MYYKTFCVRKKFHIVITNKSLAPWSNICTQVLLKVLKATTMYTVGRRIGIGYSSLLQALPVVVFSG